jgi:hypothetical protein
LLQLIVHFIANDIIEDFGLIKLRRPENRCRQKRVDFFHESSSCWPCQLLQKVVLLANQSDRVPSDVVELPRRICIASDVLFAQSA